MRGRPTARRRRGTRLRRRTRRQSVRVAPGIGPGRVASGANRPGGTPERRRFGRGRGEPSNGRRRQPEAGRARCGLRCQTHFPNSSNGAVARRQRHRTSRFEIRYLIYQRRVNAIPASFGPKGDGASRHFAAFGSTRESRGPRRFVGRLPGTVREGSGGSTQTSICRSPSSRSKSTSATAAGGERPLRRWRSYRCRVARMRSTSGASRLSAATWSAMRAVEAGSEPGDRRPARSSRCG